MKLKKLPRIFESMRGVMVFWAISFHRFCDMMLGRCTKSRTAGRTVFDKSLASNAPTY